MALRFTPIFRFIYIVLFSAKIIKKNYENSIENDKQVSFLRFTNRKIKIILNKNPSKNFRKRGFCDGFYK